MPNAPSLHHLPPVCPSYPLCAPYTSIMQHLRPLRPLVLSYIHLVSLNHLEPTVHLHPLMFNHSPVPPSASLVPLAHLLSSGPASLVPVLTPRAPAIVFPCSRVSPLDPFDPLYLSDWLRFRPQPIRIFGCNSLIYIKCFSHHPLEKPCTRQE